MRARRCRPYPSDIDLDPIASIILHFKIAIQVEQVFQTGVWTTAFF